VPDGFHASISRSSKLEKRKFCRSAEEHIQPAF
jgi:hypothetical protein